MTARRRHAARRAAPTRRARGYVLLFVLGLLAVVATVVLGASVGLRIDTQLLAREKTQLQEHYALSGAAQEAAAQLSIAYAVDALRLDPSDALLRDWPLWRANGPGQRVRLDGLAVTVQLHDVTGLPDANLLTEPEWQRLLLAAGAADAAAAQALARKIMALRERLGSLRGGPGFTSLQELLQWPEIPPAIVQGDEARGRPALAALLLVGSAAKRVHLERTPVAVIRALGTNITDEQLARLEALRRAGPIGAEQAQQWLQGTGLTAYPPGAAATAVQARLRVPDAPGGGQELVALIAGENGSFAIVDQWLEPGASVR